MEAREDDIDEDMVIVDKSSGTIGVIENLRRCIEELLETVDAQKDALMSGDDKDKIIKQLQQELNSSSKKNEQIQLEIEEMKLHLTQYGNAQLKDQEIERLVDQIEKYQSMMQEQADMIAKYSEVYEQEKVAKYDLDSESVAGRRATVDC